MKLHEFEEPLLWQALTVAAALNPRDLCLECDHPLGQHDPPPPPHSTRTEMGCLFKFYSNYRCGCRDADYPDSVVQEYELQVAKQVAEEMRVMDKPKVYTRETLDKVNEHTNRFARQKSVIHGWSR